MLHIEESAVIDARTEDVYAVIRDYEVGHPAILPKPYFTGVTVLEGGVGAGTKVRVDMNVMGRKSAFTATITEPQPGRLLNESSPVEGISTDFIFEPLENGTKTRLTFRTDMRLPSGVAGFIQNLMLKPLMRRMYREELALIAAYLR
ncbi:MAG: SRPBCC family protein [Anaerolinea sp.]|nr:SRPBCC family protein [Anaerolinea sp.]